MGVYCRLPDEGHSRDPVCVNHKSAFASLMAVVRWGHHLHPRFRKMHAMANPSDPFSSSVIPFEVPEQMRAFAEKGVSQARDNYAKFKDVAESHNGTMEAVFTTASKGASEFSAKLIEIVKGDPA